MTSSLDGGAGLSASGVNGASVNSSGVNSSAMRDLVYLQNGGHGSSALPSTIEQEFCKRLHKSAKDATDWYYKLETDADYVKMEAVKKNIVWTHPSVYGDLQVTINLSKPEKDPKEIARAATLGTDGDTKSGAPTDSNVKECVNASTNASNDRANCVNASANAGAATQTIGDSAPTDPIAPAKPQCHLCLENEGFPDGIHNNMRLINLGRLLNGEPDWYFQYSPYVYYNEHCIALSAEHTPMKIDRSSFERLAALLVKFPHYFFGSNSDIPIVGGSILGHDHFQGGSHVFPMDNAKIMKAFTHPNYPDLEIEHIFWPLSTVRVRTRFTADSALENTHIRQLVDFSVELLDFWKGYSDTEVDIIASSIDGSGNAVRHNAITPISRIVKGDGDARAIEFDLVLRNNRTSDAHPDGIFHPHAEYHHIKKENIGLIEVLGLAILPPRLEKDLLGGKYTKQYIGEVFEKVLECSGVFKLDAGGEVAFDKFMRHFGAIEC